MTNEKQSYLQRVQEEYEGYTLDSFAVKQFSFGTLSIAHNCTDITPKEIYIKYKSRMEVETVFDMYKNLLHADKSFMQSDSAFESWTFINHISCIMYYQIYNLIQSHDKLSTVSPRELLLKLSRVYKLKINNEWLCAEIPSSFSKLFNSLEITVT